jgi:4-diphosphocytidyl-2-C-methyl-D-erythritol kinase
VSRANSLDAAGRLRLGGGLVVRAFAKINVTLEVLGARDDGYHELRTVFRSIALHDRLIFEPAIGNFVIQANDPTCPTDSTNLVWRAAELVWRAARRRGTPTGVRVRIDKRVPSEAGLGGDGAAALRVVRGLWCPTMSTSRLHDLAMTLGADVPYFLQGGTVLGLDRGDRLFRLNEPPMIWIALALPGPGVRTADAFKWWDEDARARGPRRQLRGRTPKERVVLPGSDIRPEGAGNDLEAPVAARRRDIGRTLARLRVHGALVATMSGSGSACCGFFASREAAVRAADALGSSRCRTWVTRSVSAGAYARGSVPTPLSRRPR